MTREDLINEVRMRTDAQNVTDCEIMKYINDLDDNMGDTLFVRRSDFTISVEEGENEYPVPENIPSGRIKSVDIDGKRITRKKSANSKLLGWYISDYYIVISEELLEGASEITVTYHPTAEEAGFAAPDSYKELYIYYALAGIAERDGDEAGYTNFQTSYNGLLNEAIKTTTKPQLSPKFTK